MAKISKTQANKCAKVVVAYTKQEAIKHGKAGAKATAAASKVAKAGFAKLKGLFNK